MTPEERQAFGSLEAQWFNEALGCFGHAVPGNAQSDWAAWKQETDGTRLLFYGDTQERGLSDHLPLAFIALTAGYDCPNGDSQGIYDSYRQQFVEMLADIKQRASGRAAAAEDATLPLWASSTGKWKTNVSPHYAANTNNDVEFDVASVNPELVAAGKELTAQMTREEIQRLVEMEQTQLASEAALGVDLQPGERTHDFDNWTKTYNTISTPGYRLISYVGLQDYPQLFPPSLNASARFPKYAGSSRFKTFVADATKLLNDVRSRIFPAAPTTQAGGEAAKTSPAWLLLVVLAAVYFLSKGKK